MAGTSNRCEFVGFATGHFVYIQSENRMLDPDQIIQFMILFIRKKNIIQSIFFTILMSIRVAYYINNYTTS